MALIEKEREEEKIAKMEKEERDKYFRDKKKEEDRIKDIASFPNSSNGNACATPALQTSCGIVERRFEL
jgi:hypothetical protein